MKKFLAMILVLGMILGTLSGCGKFGGDESEAESETGSGSGSEELPSCSEGLTDGGFIKGVEASKYVTFPDFSTFEFKSSDLMPTDEEIEADISSLMQNFLVQDKEKTIENGDNVNIDYLGKIDGVAFEGGTAQGADVVAGSAQFIDDFLTQIIGHKPGETFDVNVTFPEDYGKEDLNGKDAVFTVTVNYISIAEELTDEWLKLNKGNFKSNTGIDASTRREVFDCLYNRAYRENVDQALSDKLIEHFKDLELPEEAEKIGKNIYDAVIELQTKMTVDQVISAGYVTEDQINEGRRSVATQILYTQAMAERENISVDDDDLKEYFASRGLSDYSAYVDYYGKGYVSNTVMYGKITEIIMKEISVDGKPGKDVLPFL